MGETERDPLEFLFGRMPKPSEMIQQFIAIRLERDGPKPVWFPLLPPNAFLLGEAERVQKRIPRTMKEVIERLPDLKVGLGDLKEHFERMWQL